MAKRKRNTTGRKNGGPGRPRGAFYEAPKRGPKADTLKLEGDWKDAMKAALAKRTPEGGWPRSAPSRRKKQP